MPLYFGNVITSMQINIIDEKQYTISVNIFNFFPFSLVFEIWNLEFGTWDLNLIYSVPDEWIKPVE